MYLPRRIRALRQHHDLMRRLNDLESENHKRDRDAAGKTSYVRILVWSSLALFVDCSCFRSKRLLFGLDSPKHVQRIFTDVVRVHLQGSETLAENCFVFSIRSAFRQPQSREVGLPVETWRGSNQVWFTVFGPGSPRIAIVEPLRIYLRDQS